MLHSAIVGKGMLKSFHFFAEDKRGPLTGAIECGADFVAYLGILGSQVKIRDFVHALFLSDDALPSLFFSVHWGAPDIQTASTSYDTAADQDRFSVASTSESSQIRGRAPVPGVEPRDNVDIFRE